MRALMRVVGALCAAGAAGAWLFLWVERPWGELGVATPPAVLVSGIFVGLAVVGGISAVRDVPVVLALAGLFSLVPVGVYFLMAPGFLPVIGWCDLGMLAAGVALVATDRAGGGGNAGSGLDSA